MIVSEQNNHSVQALLATGLFDNEDDIANAAMRYAFEVDRLEETELELDPKNYAALKALSEKTGVSISFLLNRIIERYLKAGSDDENTPT